MLNSIKNGLRHRFDSPLAEFHSDNYLRHNARRLEHLSSLNIMVHGQDVLEVGAGVGDHSTYYIDRGCNIHITDARPENIKILNKRFPKHSIGLLDMENLSALPQESYDIVHCYGLLYHLGNPKEALTYLSNYTRRYLFLETCVSFGDGLEINLVEEPKENPSQAFSGTGCRPTRPWLHQTLNQLFEYVYIPETQPNHAEFPTNWAQSGEEHVGNARAVFIASREKLELDTLTTELLMQQTHHA